MASEVNPKSAEIEAWHQGWALDSVFVYLHTFYKNLCIYSGYPEINIF